MPQIDLSNWHHVSDSNIACNRSDGEYVDLCAKIWPYENIHVCNGLKHRTVIYLDIKSIRNFVERDYMEHILFSGTNQDLPKEC